SGGGNAGPSSPSGTTQSSGRRTWSVTCLRAGIISTRSSSSCSRSSGCCSHSDCSFLGALAADENCSGFGSAACQCQRLLQLHGASLLPASLRLVLAQLRS